MPLYTKQVKGTWNVCSKIGHKGVDCFILEKNKCKKEEYMKKMNKRMNKGKGKQHKSNMKYYNCQKMGHYSNECWVKKNKNENAGLTAVKSEVTLVMKKEDDYDSSNFWIGNTGATSHMTRDLKGMFELKQVESDIQIGNRRRQQQLENTEVKLSRRI